MANVSLATFIGEHRSDLIGRCRAKVEERSSPPPKETEPDYGVPLLLIQLAKELSSGPAHTDEISGTARAHGRQLLQRGFTIDQVVRDYGDVCQSITEMAVETETAISPEDFRTLNRCLDDAIAGAVTEFAKDQDSGRENELSELWSLVNSASAAFEAVQSGSVGISGATGAILRRSLENLRAYVDRREVNASRSARSSAASPAIPDRRNVEGHLA
jgi:hypothetical protein